MSEEQVWTEESRESLRESLRSSILGELRLAKRDREEIVKNCFEVYIMDDCPEVEQDDFVRFASLELDRVTSELSAEKATWPAVTDCDRLDRVEKKLEKKGILLWQASPCCNTCSEAELPDRIDVITERSPGFSERVRGYAFFIDQNLPEMLSENTLLLVYLAYGWFSPDDSEVPDEDDKEHALAIGHEVCGCLREEGFDVRWDGDFSRKIGLSLNWRRRALLE